MKKDCWTILGIARTADATLIRRTYRDLIKKYHPDTVQAPEKIRKYTIKCVEIIQAYKDALEYASAFRHEPATIPGTEQTAPITTVPTGHSPSAFAKAFSTLILLFFVIPVIFLIIELLNIYPAFTSSIRFLFDFYDSLPVESVLKMIVSFPLALILGTLFGGVISFFTTVPVLYFLSAFALFIGAKFEKYMFKIGYVIIVALNIFVVYFITGLHWPFEHRTTNYYNFLYHLCRFVAWSSGPMYMFAEWLRDYLKYLRVKASFKSSELVLYEEDSL